MRKAGVISTIGQLMAELHGGGPLIKTQSAGGACFTINGHLVSASVAKQAIRTRRVRALDPGLFGSEFAPTWTLNRSDDHDDDD